MENFSCNLTIFSEIDEDPIELRGETEDKAKEDLQRQHMSWDSPDIRLRCDSSTPSDLKLVGIFEALEDDDDFYSGDGYEVVAIKVEDEESQYSQAHIRWSATFDFQIDGLDRHTTLDQIEQFAIRCIEINGLHVEKAEIQLDSE